jgi:hypothetical protein
MTLEVTDLSPGGYLPETDHIAFGTGKKLSLLFEGYRLNRRY